MFGVTKKLLKENEQLRYEIEILRGQVDYLRNENATIKALEEYYELGGDRIFKLEHSVTFYIKNQDNKWSGEHYSLQNFIEKRLVPLRAEKYLECKQKGLCETSEPVESENNE